MATPAEPATGAGDPATGATSDPEPTGQPPATGDPTGATWDDLFEGMTPQEVRTKLDHSRKWEDRAKNNKKALDDALKASQPKDGEPSPEDWQKQVATATERATAAEERAAELAYRSTVHTVAATAGADAEALLDSDSFLAAVEKELGDDFDDDDLKAAVTKVAKEYARKPRFAKQTGPARSGADLPGGPAGLRQLTEADLSRMSPEQIVDAQNKGQLNNLLGIT